MTLLLALALAGPPLPPLDAHAIWVEAEPGCPWTRTWLDALLGVQGRSATIVAVSDASPAEWDAWRATRPAWAADALVVVHPTSARSDLQRSERLTTSTPKVTPQGCYAVRGPELRSAEPVFTGRLDVLVDHDVCSSGETFTLLAAQVPGARVVGENTAGCLRHGDVVDIGVLPHTHLEVEFGSTAFFDYGRPVAEGLGVFPDLWLDVDDPVGLLRALPDPRQP